MVLLKRNVKRAMSIIISASMIISSTGIGFCENFKKLSDIENHWAKTQIQKLVKKGVISGYSDGTFKPNKQITRAEFIALINKAYNFKLVYDIDFKDVSADDWFYEEIRKAKAKGYISGYEDNTIRPNDLITRQEVAVIMKKVLNISTTDKSQILNKFKDKDEIDSWAKTSVELLVTRGYLNGYPDETFGPEKNITRAEAAAMLDKVFKSNSTTHTTIKKESDNESDSNSNDTKKKSNNKSSSSSSSSSNKSTKTILKDQYSTQANALQGTFDELTIDSSVGNGNVYLKNLTVTGTTYVYGGGEHSIHIKNSKLGNVVVNKEDDKVRLVAEGRTTVEKLTLKSGAVIDEDISTDDKLTESGFGDIVIEDKDKVTLKGDFDDVQVNIADADIYLNDGEVKKLDLKEKAKNTKICIGKDSKIDKVDKDSKASCTTTVDIPSDTLRKVINKALGEDRDPKSDITKDEMESIKELSSDDLHFIKNEEDEHYRGINDIEGLQYAINLEKLDLSENKISDLTPLKGLKKLNYLELDRNDIRDLIPLSGLINLEHLNIYNNAGIVDVTPITGLTKLKWIDMHYCNRRTAPVNVGKLSTLVNLEYLSIDDNFVEDVSFTKNLPKLSTFSCNNNYVTDLGPVQDLAVASYNDWSGERFFNMYGQMIKDSVKVSAGSKGTVYKMASPVIGNERYAEKVEEVAKMYGEDVQVPALEVYDGDEDYISVSYNHETDEIELIVDKNETEKERSAQTKIMLDYGMYSLKVTFDITQEGIDTIVPSEKDFEFSNGEITGYSGSKTNIVIPSTIGGEEVTAIAEKAFSKKGLTSVKIPDTVETIGKKAFEDCTSLKTIIIPSSVKSIEKDAFYNCANLTSATIPEGVESIGEYAFYKCTSLESVTIPSTLNRIGNHSFCNCEKLASLTISEGVKEIGFSVFLDCKSLTSVTIPESVEKIDEWAFSGCDNLVAINVDENNKNYSDIDGILLNKDKTVLIQYLDHCGYQYKVPEGVTKLAKGAFCSTKVTSVTLPESLETIGFSAFEECDDLISIEIPKRVTTIDHFAFGYCDNLKSIVIPENVKSIGNNAFNSCTNLESVTIDNYEGVVAIGENAIADSVKIIYLKENIEEKPKTSKVDSKEIAKPEEVEDENKEVEIKEESGTSETDSKEIIKPKEVEDKNEEVSEEATSIEEEVS